MLRFSLAACISLLAQPLLAAAVDLPYGYDGLYAPEGKRCGTKDMFVVKGGTLVGADSAIVVTEIVETPGVTGRVEATLFVRDPRGDRFDSAVIMLSADERQMDIVFMDGRALRLLRCE
jgi:hypothetical protein